MVPPYVNITLMAVHLKTIWSWTFSALVLFWWACNSNCNFFLWLFHLIFISGIPRNKEQGQNLAGVQSKLCSLKLHAKVAQIYRLSLYLSASLLRLPQTEEMYIDVMGYILWKLTDVNMPKHLTSLFLDVKKNITFKNVIKIAFGLHQYCILPRIHSEPQT